MKEIIFIFLGISVIFAKPQDWQTGNDLDFGFQFQHPQRNPPLFQESNPRNDFNPKFLRPGWDNNGERNWGTKPDWDRKPDWGVKPEWDRTPDWGVKPDWDRKPDWGTKPDWDRKPDWGTRPDWDRKPDWGTKPDWDKKPDWGTKPDWDKKPDWIVNYNDHWNRKPDWNPGQNNGWRQPGLIQHQGRFWNNNNNNNKDDYNQKKPNAPYKGKDIFQPF